MSTQTGFDTIEPQFNCEKNVLDKHAFFCVSLDGHICMFCLQVEIEGLTGDIRFNEDGRRTNYTLEVVEMSSSSDMIKVGEWSDQFHFRPITQRPDRVPHRNDFERNRTWIVTTIIEEPYIMLKKNIDLNKPMEEKDKYEGYCKDLADILAKRIGIKCKLKKKKYASHTHTHTLGLGSIVHTRIHIMSIFHFNIYTLLHIAAININNSTMAMAKGLDGPNSEQNKNENEKSNATIRAKRQKCSTNIHNSFKWDLIGALHFIQFLFIDIFVVCRPVATVVVQ